ncbi:MAG: nickel-dependent lactate racemase [Spirochaetota bacterium]
MAFKTVSLEYGKKYVEVKMPQNADILYSGAVNPLPDSEKAIALSLEEPIDSPPLKVLARGKKKAVVVLSDNTRPVPYKGPGNIIGPVIKTLKDAGVPHIKLIIATGTHRPLKDSELREMLDPACFQSRVAIINHVATDMEMLTRIGSTRRTADVLINRHYLEADLKILTGLVEPHLMAGFSGGRKSVCPGVCGQAVTHGFHSARMVDEPNATSLVIDGNPCHAESLTIARMAGVDFIVNVTLDRNKRITGIFSGNLENAHRKAVDFCRAYTSIPIDKLYNVVIITAGHVGVNHYQCAKAAVEASRALKQGGSIIILANLTDPDPFGGDSYKSLLPMIIQRGTKKFREMIFSSDWSFVPEQWQIQLWTRAYERTGSPRRIFFCAPRFEDYAADSIPETNAAVRIRREGNENELAYAKRLVENSLQKINVDTASEKEILILPDGPYAVPVLRKN